MIKFCLSTLRICYKLRSLQNIQAQIMIPFVMYKGVCIYSIYLYVNVYEVPVLIEIIQERFLVHSVVTSIHVMLDSAYSKWKFKFYVKVLRSLVFAYVRLVMKILLFFQILFLV